MGFAAPPGSAPGVSSPGVSPPGSARRSRPTGVSPPGVSPPEVSGTGRPRSREAPVPPVGGEGGRVCAWAGAWMDRGMGADAGATPDDADGSSVGGWDTGRHGIHSPGAGGPVLPYQDPHRGPGVLRRRGRAHPPRPGGLHPLQSARRERRGRRGPRLRPAPGARRGTRPGRRPRRGRRPAVGGRPARHPPRPHTAAAQAPPDPPPADHHRGARRPRRGGVGRTARREPRGRRDRVDRLPPYRRAPALPAHRCRSRRAARPRAATGDAALAAVTDDNYTWV